MWPGSHLPRLQKKIRKNRWLFITDRYIIIFLLNFPLDLAKRRKRVSQYNTRPPHILPRAPTNTVYVPAPDPCKEMDVEESLYIRPLSQPSPCSDQDLITSLYWNNLTCDRFHDLKYLEGGTGRLNIHYCITAPNSPPHTFIICYRRYLLQVQFNTVLL